MMEKRKVRPTPDEFFPETHVPRDILPQVGSSSANDRAFLFAFGIVDAAIYLIGVIAIGVHLNNSVSWFGALVSAGLGYLAAFVQLSNPSYRGTAVVLVVTSIAAGIIAGFNLLW